MPESLCGHRSDSRGFAGEFLGNHGESLRRSCRVAGDRILTVREESQGGGAVEFLANHGGFAEP